MIIFLLYLAVLNITIFFTTFNPKSLVNPFNIRSRTSSCYLLFKYIIADTGVIIRTMSMSEMSSHINEYSKDYNIDPELIKIVIEVESNYREFAISRTGAIGLMQVMPRTFNEMGFEKPFDAKQNLEAGIKYLSIQLKRFKRLDLALSAYNAGPTRISKEMKVPKIGETASYVKRIMGKYRKIRHDYNGYMPLTQ